MTVASPLDYTYMLLKEISAGSMTTSTVPVPSILKLEEMVKTVSVIVSQFASCSSTKMLVNFLECTMYGNIKVNKLEKGVPRVMSQKDKRVYLIVF